MPPPTSFLQEFHRLHNNCYFSEFWCLLQLPLDELVRTLGFDDQNEAAQFCQFFGLTTDESCVTLDKAMFIEPEENWCPRRSALIEQKRTTSIGEVSSHVTCHIRCSIQLRLCFICFTCTSTCLTVMKVYLCCTCRNVHVSYLDFKKLA